MPYKRTTRSGNGKTRTTHTQSISKNGTRSSKVSYSSGGGNTRVTKTTNLNTGQTKTYVTNRSGGWIDRKCVSPSPVKSSTKFPKAKRPRKRKSKPMKLSEIMLLMLAFIIVMSIL